MNPFMLLIILMCFSFPNNMSFAMGKAPAASDPEVVSEVDLQRYVGKWYEVAHSPNFFQRKCVSSTAEYELLEPGRISVLNTCYKASGRTSHISGYANVVNAEVPAKLKVRFSFFQKGDYWITELDPEYRWAVVSSPGKRFTFILARSVPLPADQQQQILDLLKSKGFETESFVFDQY